MSSILTFIKSSTVDLAIPIVLIARLIAVAIPISLLRLRSEFEQEKRRFFQARTRFLTGKVADTWRRLIRSIAERRVAQGAAVRNAEETRRLLDVTASLAAAIEPNSTLLLAEMAKLQLKSAAAEQFALDLRIHSREAIKNVWSPLQGLDIVRDTVGDTLVVHLHEGQREPLAVVVEGLSLNTAANRASRPRTQRERWIPTRATTIPPAIAPATTQSRLTAFISSVMMAGIGFCET